MFTLLNETKGSLCCLQSPTFGLLPEFDKGISFFKHFDRPVPKICFDSAPSDGRFEKRFIEVFKETKLLTTFR